jgi:hypothetical protein
LNFPVVAAVLDDTDDMQAAGQNEELLGTLRIPQDGKRILLHIQLHARER